MGLSEIKRRILLKNVKEKKKLEKMLNEFEEIHNRIIELKKEIKKFEKRWGKYYSKQPELINILTREILGIAHKNEKDVKSTIGLEILSIAKDKKITLIPLSDLIPLIKERMPGEPLTLDTVEKVIDHLKKRNLIPGIVEIKGIKYVQLKEIEEDIKTILTKFKDREYITLNEAVETLGWDLARTQNVLEKMVKIGLAVKEEYPPRYWIIRFEEGG
ncbi:MAG: hypothetical protein ACP6IP_00680 [Candidatus Njordarchaeia archaeon]